MKAVNNMTESEAIEKLRAYHKCRRLQVKGIYEDCNEKLCDNCDLCYAQGNAGEHIKSIEIAIQALEKHIPMKVLHSYEDSIDENWCSCPICCSSLGWYHGKHYKYCMNCGQKLVEVMKNETD